MSSNISWQVPISVGCTEFMKGYKKRSEAYIEKNTPLVQNKLKNFGDRLSEKNPSLKKSEGCAHQSSEFVTGPAAVSAYKHIANTGLDYATVALTAVAVKTAETAIKVTTEGAKILTDAAVKIVLG